MIDHVWGGAVCPLLSKNILDTLTYTCPGTYCTCGSGRKRRVTKFLLTHYYILWTVIIIDMYTRMGVAEAYF